MKGRLDKSTFSLSFALNCITFYWARGP